MFGLVWVTNKIYARIRVTSAWRAPPAARSESEETLSNMYCWPKQSLNQTFSQTISFVGIAHLTRNSRSCSRALYCYFILDHIWFHHTHSCVTHSCVTSYSSICDFMCDSTHELIHLWHHTSSYVTWWYSFICDFVRGGAMPIFNMEPTHMWHPLSHEVTRMNESRTHTNAHSTWHWSHLCDSIWHPLTYDTRSHIRSHMNESRTHTNAAEPRGAQGTRRVERG